MKLLNKKEEILKAHLTIIKMFEKSATGGIVGSVGYQGGAEEVYIEYSEKVRFWWIYESEPYWEGSNKLWNVFGLGIPKENSLHNIVCEINYEIDNYNPKLGGALAKDKYGNLFLLHNGNIGGGRKGIGKVAFRKNYKLPLVSITLNGETQEFAIVGAINSKHFLKEVLSFIREIYRIKKLVVDGAKVTFSK